jgi:hypothetical protein
MALTQPNTRRDTMKSTAITLAAAMAVAASTMPALADILAAKARTDYFEVPAGIAPVPLDDKGNSSLQFTTTKKGIVVITYNAECSATGPAGNWVGLEIRVNGKIINPKADMEDFAFCSATNDSDLIYTAVSRQGFVKLGPGEHGVQVVVSKQGVDSAYIDDGSLIIED